MGKQRKQENYWDSEEADKDRAKAEKLQSGGADSESEEEVAPAPKGKGKQAAAPAKKNQNGGGKKNQKVESESESEEEVAPTKKGAKPAAKLAAKQPAKKGSIAKKMLESPSESESASESESEEDVAPKKPAPAKGKKAAAAAPSKKVLPPSDDSESEESESESEEEVAPAKKGAAKPAAKPAAKQAAAAKKGSIAKKMLESPSESESEQSESESEEDVAPKKPAPAKGKKAAAAAPSKKVLPPSESESEESESDSEEEVAPAKKGAAAKPAAKPAAKQAAKPAPAPAKKAAAAAKGKKNKQNYWDEDFEKDAEDAKKIQDGTGSPAAQSASESESEEEVKTPAPKKEATPAAPAAAATGKAAAKKKNNKKKPGAQEKKPQQEEKLSGFLLKQREEEERKKKEEDERKKKAEEEAILAAIKEKEDEERNKIKAAEKAKKKAERKAIEAEEQKERERIERIEKLKATGFKISALENAAQPGDAKKVVVYSSKKKPGKKDNVNQLAEQVSEIKIEETTPTTSSPPAEEEVMESWDADGWESLEDIQKRKEEEEKQRLEEEEKKRKEEKEAAKREKKAGKKGSKDSKSTTTTTTTAAGGNPENQETPAEKELRSPILCILGHVDTGKTSLLDKIRSTNVQGGEARGITQQIGASFVPVETIKEQTKGINEKLKVNFRLPGLLLIDTPGHESFNNLRSRGSGLCDLAILVIDIVHGIEKQTVESINLLRMRKTPFVVALNKVDRVYEWQKYVNLSMNEELKLQNRHTAQDFESRTNKIIAQLAEHELNAALYWRNSDYKKVVSLVPTSAVTGEGLGDLMLVVVQLMQKIMSEKVTYRNTLECTILEVKAIEGLGTTVDAVLVNGVLNEGDKIVVSGFGGPIVTTIRSLLTPPPLRETRVKTALIPNKSIRASMGVKIVAPGLEKAVAGTSLYVVGEDDDLEELKREAQKDVDSVLATDDTEEIGVTIQASTLGSLEAFSTFLKGEKIPVAFKAIGPVHKKHVMNAAIMANKDPKYAILLAFGVKVEESAMQTANELKITIMSEETIYLFVDRLKTYFGAIKEKLREQTANVCVWPCLLDVIKVFRQKDPILVGVRIKEGTLRIGTPLVLPDPNQQHVDIGVVQSIKLNEKDVNIAKKDDEVSISIDDSNTKTTFGRHFDDKKDWYSKISRDSIDALKEAWSDELTKQDKQLIVFMKGVFKIN
ncbi:eukaryotic translation initiation factor 5B [Heterostelium album PN500]|uniref:Eukaryotic translation initiation factor 5B n=1 Tax=Heterostelium pallidum (strain ATCC 26659 / Pp 5 / PN500) TaxID=670386 RepID=D3BFQ1_HETP5|nr:eukaryotic translation initiation factor 5B [Heterostelium album PN500]EFA79965.1 eukaryotic translation initiation factor 5B [Heterostelium album PN500]|eukprot:XP_020432085.1 eukaryotic translation initiation factor 5B [Heterostelium album PN500]